MSEKEALKIHGYVFSSDSEDSHCNGSNSSSESDFDAKYSALKPPPLSAEVLETRSVRVTKAPETEIRQNKTKISGIPNCHKYHNNETKNVPNKQLNLRDNHNGEQGLKQSNQKSKRRDRSSNKRAKRNRNTNSKVKQQNTENFKSTKCEPNQQVLPKKENNTVAVVNNNQDFRYNTRNKATEWKLNFEALRNRQIKDSVLPYSAVKNVAEKQRQTIETSNIHNMPKTKNSVISISLQNAAFDISETSKSDKYHEEEQSKTCKTYVGHITCAQNDFRDTPSHVENIDACNEICNEIIDTVSYFKDDVKEQGVTIEVVDIHNAPTRRISRLSIDPQNDTSNISECIKIHVHKEIKPKVYETYADHITCIQKEFEDATSLSKDREENYHLQSSDNKKDLSSESNTVNHGNSEIAISSVPKVIKLYQVQPIEENQAIESSYVSLKERDNLDDVVYWWDICYIIRKCFQSQKGESAT